MADHPPGKGLMLRGISDVTPDQRCTAEDDRGGESRVALAKTRGKDRWKRKMTGCSVCLRIILGQIFFSLGCCFDEV